MICRKPQLFCFKSKRQSGSSLIEVLVATVIIAISLVGVSIIMMYSVARTAQARYEDIAKSLAQDAIETFHKERAYTGWDAFNNRFTSGGSYCVDTASQTITSKSGSCTGISQVGMTFNREITITKVNGAIRVNSSVKWEGGKSNVNGVNSIREVVLTQDFRKLY